MKFTVLMKDPDTLHDAIRDAVRAEVAKLGLDDVEERMAVEERRHEKVGEVCSRWFKYGEYLAVEIDTEAGTCTVLGAK